MGETDECIGLEVTMTNMKELQDVLVMLGLNVKHSPKLSSAKIGTVGDVIKEEVSAKTLEDLEVRNHENQMMKKSSIVKMRM
jgi:hypothetical protein